MKTKNILGKMLTMLLAVAVAPLCLLAENYYTKGTGGNIFATKNNWVDIDNDPAPSAPSSGNQYWIVYKDARFEEPGVFGGDLLGLGLPSGAAVPDWADGSIIYPKKSGTYTIDDFRLYSGKIYARSYYAYDMVIAGTATVYSTTRDGVELRAYINSGSYTIDHQTSRSINLAADLKGQSDAFFTIAAGNYQNGYWPAYPMFLILSGDFSEYHGRFSVEGSLILLNTATAFGCEADGEKADVYNIYENTTMAIAADKSTSMSRTRGITIAANRTLTFTTTNEFDGVSYSGYTVTFPVKGGDNSALVKSGEGKVTLDSAFTAVRTINVEKGILGFGAGYASFADTTNLVLAAGTSVELADGACATFATVSVGGVCIDPGIYTGTGGPAYAKVAQWISGTGTLLVRPSETPEATVEDTWKAAGDAGEMSAASSWVRESAPDLATGEFLPTFANAGSGAVVDAGSVVKGIVFDAANDFALAGASPLTVLGGGVTAAAAERRYMVSAPLVAGLSQTWSVGENATVAIEGNFGGPRAATVTKTGSGTLDISGTNLFAGTLAVTDGRLRLSGVFGSSAETDGTLSVANTGNTGMTLAGATINKPVTHQVKNVSEDLTVEAGTTNTFNGQVAYSRGGSFDFYMADGAVVIYNDGLSVALDVQDKEFSIKRSGSVTTSPLVRFCGRPSILSSVNVFRSEVICRFEVTGNSIKKYRQTGKDRLEATVDYAWNGTDGIERFTLAGAGSVIDVGSTRQCIQDITILNNTDSYYANVVGDGGTLELAPTEDMTLALNQMRFGERVSLQKHGAATLTLTNKTATIYSQSYGDVAVTNGVLEFAADASWLNGTNVTVSGSGELKINKANTFNREHAVIHFADNGRINVPAGVTQVFAEGWDGDNKMRGIYDAGNSSRVTGGGAIQVGKIPGLILIVR